MVKGPEIQHDRIDPSPSEIELRIQEVQQSWTVRQRKSRAVSKEKPWIPPTIGAFDFPGDAVVESDR